MLTTVTITGADDEVDPSDLAKLSDEFHFVEWGILMSPKREGTPRYPTRAWIDRLAGFAAGGMKLSAHFCGACARDTLAGDSKWLDALPVAFSRVQLNGFEIVSSKSFYEMFWDAVRPEIILQVRDEGDLRNSAFIVARAIGVTGSKASALFDPSAGRGIEIRTWPTPPNGLSTGYAGGIGPGNVEAVLRAIGLVERDFWIDMESGVRTGDRFDLALVRQVLERARPFVKERCR